MMISNETDAARFLLNQRQYYSKLATKANREYVRTGKLSDRLAALKYNAKVELLDDLMLKVVE